MKLVDEKGKLFGKINLIDLLVLVVIVAALAFAAYRFLGGGSAALDQTTRIDYTVLAPAVDDTSYQEIQRQLELAGGQDQLMADGKLLDGYVTGVTAAPHAVYDVDANGNATRSEEDPANGGRWDLTFTVTANVVDPITTKIGTQEVRVGKSHILKTTHFELATTTILTCDWAE